jgi:integrase
MAGQIIKRGERTWVVRIFMGRDGNGKRRYFNKTIRGTAKDAQKYLNAALRDQDLGTFIEPSSMTLDEYLDKWLSAATRGRVRESTYTYYVEILDRYVRSPLGYKQLSALRPEDLLSLYTEMQDRGLSSRTVRHTHVAVSLALKQAVRWKMLAQNPATAVDPPRQVRKEMQALSVEEANRFLMAAAEDRWGVLFMLALTTGMRPEEYFGLQWKDVDFEQGVVTVQRALVWRRKGGGWYFCEPKTSRSRRSIPLPASVVKALAEHKRKQLEARMKIGSEYQNRDIVFATKTGGPLDRRHISRRNFKQILERAKLPANFRLYDLRHSCATLLLAANENPKIVSERLGHSSVVITLDTYSHVLPSMQRAASEKIESMLFTKSGTL